MVRRIRPAPKPAGENPGSRRVEFVSVETPVFMTITRESPAWRKQTQFTLPPPGTFVRLRPPHDVDAEVFAHVKRRLEKSGCYVQVERARGPRTVPEEALARVSAKGMRETVAEIVETGGSRNKEALKAECEEAMGEAGL
jgi:hypothetical protein